MRERVPRHKVAASDTHRGEQVTTWRTGQDALRLVLERGNLLRTGLTAVIVGAVLFAINQLDVVLAGHASAVTWVKVGVTFLVPLCVANIGLLLGRRWRG